MMSLLLTFTILLFVKSLKKSDYSAIEIEFVDFDLFRFTQLNLTDRLDRTFWPSHVAANPHR